MTIPSSKPIIMNCACNPKLKFIYFFLSMGHFDSSLTKNHDTLIFFYILAFFFSNMGVWWCYSKKYFECTFCTPSLLEDN